LRDEYVIDSILETEWTTFTSLSTLVNETALEQFLNVIAWAVERAKTSPRRTDESAETLRA
jgi:hypothetical protein